MDIPHFKRKEELGSYPELLRWDIKVSADATAVEPEDLVAMLMDHAVEAPNSAGLCISVFGVDYLTDTIVMVSRPKEDLVIVLTLDEAERLLSDC